MYHVRSVTCLKFKAINFIYYLNKNTIIDGEELVKIWY